MKDAKTFYQEIFSSLPSISFALKIDRNAPYSLQAKRKNPKIKKNSYFCK
ncbi:MAG: hypothetical protein AB8E82_19470 [Aureispira sp.]